jgi:hypothetical protein
VFLNYTSTKELRTILGALEATTQLSERLSQELDPKLFWKDGTPLRVTEIVDRVCRTIGAEEGGKRG